MTAWFLAVGRPQLRQCTASMTVTLPPIRRTATRALITLALAVTTSAANATPAARAETAARGDHGAPAGCTGPASGTWLRVIVEGVHNANGQIAITLYDDDSSRFLVKHGSLYVGRTPAVAGATPSCIFVPHPGVYVLAVYHDENGNGRFDRTGIGLPAEAYGFSNNPATLLGLPSFDSVRLNVARSGLTAHVQLTYP